MALYKTLDLRSGAKTVAALQRTAEITELDVHDIEWAIEEYGACETDRHMITLVGDDLGGIDEDENQCDAEGRRDRCTAVITDFFSVEELEDHLASAGFRSA